MLPSQSSPLVIGLDCSTTACKAIVWDPSGTAVGEGRASLELNQPHPGWHEQSAESWFTAACQAIRAACQNIYAYRLAGLCLSIQRETFVTVDSQGKPLRPAIVWMDERCRSLLSAIGQTCGADTIHRITGKPLSGNLALGKIAWIRQYEPEIFKAASAFLDVHAYLALRLTGQAATGFGCADPLGLFDLQRLTWADHLLQVVGSSPAQMPPAFPTGTFLGYLLPEVCTLCGLPAYLRLPLFAGIGDGQAAALGAGLENQNDIYLNLGTAVISGSQASQYLTNPAFRTMLSALPGTYLLETVLLGGAYTVRWFIEKFGMPPGCPPSASPAAAWDASAESILPGAEGLMLVPYWNSAMNPFWDASASGIVAGWRGVHTPAHLFRAILEGIGFELRLSVTGVEAALGTSLARLIAVGGGARSQLWCQIIADITGKFVQRSKTREASSLGAAIIAAQAAGIYSTIKEASEKMTCLETEGFSPDPARQALYIQLFEQVYQYLYPALQPYLKSLTILSEQIKNQPDSQA